jgi:hypothetical protein
MVDFLSIENVEILYSILKPTHNYQLITVLTLHFGEPSDQMISDMVDKFEKELKQKNTHILATSSNIGSINPLRKNLKDLGLFSKIAVHTVLENYIKDTLKSAIIQILEEHQGALETNSLVDIFNERCSNTIQDYQIAILLREMKEELTIQYQNTKFGSFFIPTGLINLSNYEHKV